jgi:hypothetical protein
MKCEEVRDLMPDLAAGKEAMPLDVRTHVDGCGACATKLEDFRKTMALLDEWTAPEPSQYFDVRLQARLREEMAKAPTGWLHWLRRPALAGVLTLALAGGAGLLYRNGSTQPPDAVVSDAEPGSAVSDMQALERNHEIYTDFELLDDLEVQHDVVANP